MLVMWSKLRMWLTVACSWWRFFFVLEMKPVLVQARSKLWDMSLTVVLVYSRLAICSEKAPLAKHTCTHTGAFVHAPYTHTCTHTHTQDCRSYAHINCKPPPPHPHPRNHGGFDRFALPEGGEFDYKVAYTGGHIDRCQSALWSPHVKGGAIWPFRLSPGGDLGYIWPHPGQFPTIFRGGGGGGVPWGMQLIGALSTAIKGAMQP